MGLRLIIEDYEGSTTVFPLGENAVTIGREESNTICLTEKNVSRQHARLVPAEVGWTVEDLESYNGIRVNGSVVDEGHLIIHEGDLIQIGDYQLLLGDDTSTRATVDLGPSLLAAANEGGLAAAGLPVAAALREAVREGARVVDEDAIVAPATALDSDYDDLEAEQSGGGAGKAVLVLALLGGLGAGGWWFTMGPGSSANSGPQDPIASGEPSGAAETPGGSASLVDAPSGEPAQSESSATPESESSAEDGQDEGEGEEPAQETEEAEVEAVQPTVTKKKKKKKKKKATTPTPTTPTPTPPAVPAAGKSAGELLSDARKAQLRGSYSKAYSLAKKSYAASKSVDAAQVMGVAACKMGDAGKAKSAYGKLSGSKKSALKAVCSKAGIEL